MLKKREKTLKICAHPEIDPGPDTLTTTPRGQVVRRSNSIDSATIVFVTRVIVYVIGFRLSNIYLSLVLRRSVLKRCQ